MEVSWWIRCLAQICGGRKGGHREGAESRPLLLGLLDVAALPGKNLAVGAKSLKLMDWLTGGCCVYSGRSGRGSTREAGCCIGSPQAREGASDGDTSDT